MGMLHCDEAIVCSLTFVGLCGHVGGWRALSCGGRGVVDATRRGQSTCLASSIWIARNTGVERSHGGMLKGMLAGVMCASLS